jgi:hypothetical protein
MPAMTRDELESAVETELTICQRLGKCGPADSARHVMDGVLNEYPDLAALLDGSMVAVPAEPTEAMQVAGWETLPDYEPGCDDAANCYAAMIAAAKEGGER